MVYERKWTLVIADDHPLVREGLKIWARHKFAQNELFIREVDNGKDLVPILMEGGLDLLIMDLSMPGMDGLEVIKQIDFKKGTWKTIVLTEHNDSKLVKQVMKAGIEGFCLKSCSLHDLDDAVRQINRGESYLSAGVSLTGELAKNLTAENHKDFATGFTRKHCLTRREREVLQLVAKALTNKQIGKELFISDQTVSVHRKNIMRKLGVKSTAELIRMVFVDNLVPVSS